MADFSKIRAKYKMLRLSKVKAARKKDDEPSWKKNARISDWKANQPFWVIVASGDPSNSGYVKSVNTSFGIIECTKVVGEARRYYRTDAHSIANDIKRFGVHKVHIEYVGPKHKDE